MRKSPLDDYRAQIEAWLSEGVSQNQIVNNLAELGIPTSNRSVGRALIRWGSGMVMSGDEAAITSKPSTTMKTAEDLMEERDLNPEEWEIISVIVNTWDSPTGDTLNQLKVHLKRKVPMNVIAPARTDGPTFKAKKKAKEDTTRVVLVGDQQAPYQDERLHDAFCNFLADYQPHKGVLIGDTIDLPDISRHPANPETDVTVQECIDAGYNILKNYREANEDTAWQKLAGNHDERLRRIVVDNVRQIYGVRRAAVPGEILDSPVLDVSYLLRLDELGIEYTNPNGDYEQAQVTLSPNLAARHGWIARKGSGASALATLDHLGYSVVIGHSHRQSLVHKTYHTIEGKPYTLAAAETGCMCRIDGGLGYAVSPNWQNGFTTAEIFPDGTFKLDLATYVDGKLYFRNTTY